MNINDSKLPEEEIRRLSKVTGVPLGTYGNNISRIPHHVKIGMVEIGSVYNAEMPWFNYATKQMEMRLRPVLVVGKHGDDDIQVIEITPYRKENNNQNAYIQKIGESYTKGTALNGETGQINVRQTFSMNYTNILLPRTGSLIENSPQIMEAVQHRMRMSVFQASLNQERFVDEKLVQNEIELLRDRIHNIDKALIAAGHAPNQKRLMAEPELSQPERGPNPVKEPDVLLPEQKDEDTRRYMDDTEIQRLSAYSGLPLDACKRNRRGVPILPPYQRKKLFEPGSVYWAKVCYYETATKRNEFKDRPVIVLDNGPGNELIVAYVSSTERRKISENRIPYLSWINPNEKPLTKLEKISHIDAGKIFSVNQGNLQLPRLTSIRKHYPLLMQEIQAKMRQNVLLLAAQADSIKDVSLLRQEEAVLQSRLAKLENQVLAMAQIKEEKRKEAMKNTGKNKWAALKKNPQAKGDDGRQD